LPSSIFLAMSASVLISSGRNWGFDFLIINDILSEEKLDNGCEVVIEITFTLLGPSCFSTSPSLASFKALALSIVKTKSYPIPGLFN
jgi:hypothetical protein